MNKAGSILRKGTALLLTSAMLFQFSFTAAAAATPDTQPPSVPKGLAVTNKTYTSLSLSWAAATDNVKVKGYELYRDGRRIVTTTKTSYTNMRLVPGKSYTYSVKAYDAAGNISQGCTPLEFSTLRDTQAPTAPGSLSAASESHTSVSLTWKPSTDNTGIKGYEIYRDGKKIASTTSTGYVSKKLSPGQTYAFTVKAYDIAGNYSPASRSCYAVTIPDKEPPSRPTGLKASQVTETEATVAWSASSDNVKVKGYEVYCDGKKVTTTTKTSYKRKGLAPGKSYSFTVKALDTVGNISGESSRLNVTTLRDLQPPQAPTGLTAKAASGTSVSLKWSASSDNIKVKGYYIYCNGIKVASTTRTSYTVKGLRYTNIAVFTVKAYDSSENLSKSSKAVIAILP